MSSAPSEPGPADTPSVLAAAAARMRLREHLGAREAHAIDPLLLREVARAFTPAGGDDLLHAVALARGAGLEHRVWHDLVARLLPDAGPPAPAVLPALAELLDAGVLRDLPTPLLARLVAVPALHGPAARHLLAAIASHHTDLHALYSQLLALPSADPSARDDLLAAVVAQSGDEAACIATPLGAGDRDRFAACLAAWTTRATPTTWLAVYRDLDLIQSSQMIDALLALPPARDPDLARLRDEAAAQWTPHGEDEAAAAMWLRAALDARLPPT